MLIIVIMAIKSCDK